MNLTELKEITKAFETELELSNKGKKTSLPYLVHEMPEFSLVKDGETFQVVIVGGTYAISAMAQKNGTSCKILSQKKTKLPNLMNREDFLLFIDQVYNDTCKILVLNFAFPILPVFERGKLDGELLKGTKGHTFRGVVGKKIGEQVENFILRKRKKEIIVSVANDTVCLLLSGLEKTSWKNLGAGIVGTGMNFAFYLTPTTLVNLESADFDKFTQSESGLEIDQESANPGKSHYEKEVAGVYLYKHFNILARRHDISYKSLTSTEELDKLARENKGEAGKLARSLIERSAGLIAAQIAAIMEFRKTDMLFVMEGSLFWKGYEYKKTVEEALLELTKYKADFTEIKNSGIIGAVHLVM